MVVTPLTIIKTGNTIGSRDYDLHKTCRARDSAICVKGKRNEIGNEETDDFINKVLNL